MQISFQTIKDVVLVLCFVVMIQSVSARIKSWAEFAPKEILCRSLISPTRTDWKIEIILVIAIIDKYKSFRRKPSAKSSS